MSLETPCIGICSTIYGDEVCRGCKRTFQEIIGWNTYCAVTKQNILHRLDQVTSTITASKLVVDDPQKLHHQLTQQAIRFRQEFSCYYWAYTLLRATADEITDIHVCGLRIKPTFQALSLRQLIDQIDDEIYAESCSAQS